MSNIRVRFAPSPTGYLHIGGVRTALFNWLWARKNGGKFVLRIEDTDQERSTPESKAVILESLKWLGMDWDEGPEVGGDFGPYEQMARLNVYREFANKLIAEGKAYKCYCTQEDLDAERQKLDQLRKETGNNSLFFKYPGTCRDRKGTRDEAPFVVRFRAPTEGVVEYTDKVFGKVVTPNKENQDFVLLRSDGVPLYNFGAVIDDLTMGITLVARGRDHMINTPPQILIYNALGVQPPEFAHLPMMLSPEGQKLSKRHGAVSVTEYRDKGYSPTAVLNYLARFGWGFGNQEVFSLKQLIDAFSWDGCGKNDGRFDVKKFAAIQAEHLKREDLTSNEEYAHRVLPFLFARGVGDLNHKRVESVVHLVRTRSKTYIEAANELDPILRNEITVEQTASEKFLVENNKKLLRSFGSTLTLLEEWNENSLREYANRWCDINKLTLKDIGQPLRVSITGRANSPELFQVMEALGKDTTIKRIFTNSL